MKKSKINYEKYLNLYYSGLSLDEVTNTFQYLTDKTRYRYCSPEEIELSYQKKTVGLLIRRYDSRTFDAWFEQWINPNKNQGQ
jgi:hypothetical protein